jgi:hypothetical protein
MPFELDLPLRLKKEGWKVKIFEDERLEPPHVTVIRGLEKWRIGLRDRQFMIPPGGSWKDFPKGLREKITGGLQSLIDEWDEMYPENPVGGHDE